MNVRVRQIESALLRAVSDVLTRGLNDPRVAGMVSVTGVVVSPDMREARVKVSITPDHKSGIALHALREAAGHIRREAGNRVQMRRLPNLHFELDPSLKKLSEVLGVIHEAIERTGPLPPEMNPDITPHQPPAPEPAPAPDPAGPQPQPDPDPRSDGREGRH